METTKTALFDAEVNELAGFSKALAHPARVATLQHILRANACINGDLVEETGLVQARVSQHLKTLKEAGLIKGSIEGTSMCFCIDPGNWKKMQHSLNQLFGQYPSPEDHCC